jgi:predicted Zn-dependent protease
MGIRANLLAMLERGNDSAMLRFSLAGEMLKDGDIAEAIEHAQKAVEMQPDYSAAWKLLGKACVAANDSARAIAAYSQGIDVSEARGDKQAAKEMRVFLKRLQRDT